MGKSKIHECYCRKLEQLGNLGYDTHIPRSGLYHLANPDAVWYVDMKIEGFNKIPLFVLRFYTVSLKRQSEDQSLQC